MTPMTGAQLHAVRKAAADRYTAITLSYVPEGYRVEYRRSLSGMHYGKAKLIKAPRPVTRKALYIFLHECAHAHLNHMHKGVTPRHVEEMEAEQWAHATMRQHDVAVPKAMTKRAKQYVARKIRQAERSGAKAIDPAARRYAKGA